MPRSTWALLGLLGVMIAIAIGQGYRRNHPEHMDPLAGDMETATGGVDDALRKTPTAQRVPLLLKYMQQPNSGLRYAAVDALGEQRGPEVAAAIEGAFTDSASVVRQRALETLPVVDKERGLRLLLAGLRDQDLWIRQAAAGQLYQYEKLHLKGVDRAVPSLIAALDDPDDAVSNTSMNTLRHITGQPWRVTLRTPPAQRLATIQRWQQWWAQEGPKRAVPADFAHIAAISPTRTDPAPDFNLSDIDGHTLSLDGQHGKLTLLNFWGTWCPPCKQEVPDLVKLDQSYRGRGLEIAGIALGEDSADGLRRWCHTHGIAYRQALSTRAIQDAFGHIDEVPVSVLIDGQGRIRYRWEGERDYATFSAAVERLLKEQGR